MNYAAFLRGLDPLSWEQRTISGLGIEVNRLRDHIRAVAGEMRAVAPPTVARSMEDAAIAQVLHRFADKLEGKEQ